MLIPEIDGGRIVLRPFVAGDLDALATLYTDTDNMRFIGGARTREQARVELTTLLADFDLHGWGPRAVTLRETDELIGRAGLWLQHVDGKPEIEVAYLIAHEHQRQGYATEAATLLRDQGFGLGVDHLVSLIDPGNSPSAGVARKIGMERRRQTVWDGRTMDVYAITRAQWAAVTQASAQGAKR